MRPLEPLKFVMVTEGRIASASIFDRVFSGLHQQGAWDYEACYERERVFADIGNAIEGANVVLFLRSSRPEEVRLLELAKQRGVATVYCLDDDFDTLDPSTPNGEFYGHAEMRAARDRFIRDVDLVWVFTKELAERLRDRCERMHIGRLPSFVEDHGWDLRSLGSYGDAEELVTLGYGGGDVHLRDLDVVVAPLRRILDSLDRPVRAEFINCVPRALEKHPRVRRVPYFHDIQQYYEYVRTAGWSIGLAPLRDTVDNRAKTNNKYREYAALGVPGIYSDMPVYASSVRHKETGYLAAHTEQGMYEAMLTMISDVDLRRRIRANALVDAATTYAMLPMQQEWLREASRLASRRDQPVRLLVVGYDSVTSTHIDALPASRALTQQGRAHFDYVQPSEIQREDVMNCDAIFLVRAFEPATVRLLEWAEEAEVALVCAWDDDFYALPPDTPLGQYYAQEIVRSAVDRFLRGCSLIATSTPPLTERSRRYNANVMEAIYGFDTVRLPVASLPDDPHDGERPLKIGFFGLHWEFAPQCVREAIREVRRRFGQRVWLEIISRREVPGDSEDLFDWRSSRDMGWQESLELLRSRGWDIGVAPLEDTEFNSAKQATKFRDYAWAGMAMICSRVPPYRRAIIDGIHGLLVDNTQIAWESAIARLIDERNLRGRLRQAARDLFIQAHTLDATMCSWDQLLWRIARHRDARRLPELQRLPEYVASATSSPFVDLPRSTSGASASRPLTGARFYEIVPEADGWEAVEVMVGLHQRVAAGRLVLSIYAADAFDRPLRRVEGDLAAAIDNSFFRFRFPPIAHSAQRRMLLRFHLEDGSRETRVSLYERRPPPDSLVGRALDTFSDKGGPLLCRMGFRS